MKFIVSKTYPWDDPKEEVEINTLEEFIKFCEECDNPVIIDGNELEIYNDYRE